MTPRQLTLETDPRFPSGRWTGFYIQPWIPGRHMMSLDMTFEDGCLEAQGTDRVGAFTFSGTYDTENGKCQWTKQYRGKHRVSYAGFNEGKGIWGIWDIRFLWGLYHDRGVFHLWPEGMAVDAEAELTERALLQDVGRRPPFQVVVGAVILGLLVAALIIFKMYGRQWIEQLFR